MQHKDLETDRWFKLTAVEQLANIGSEIERAIKWRNNNNHDRAMAANNRALELFDLSLNDPKHKVGVKEFCRARELWLDFFIGENQFFQTEDIWHRYVMAYTTAARNKFIK